MSKVFRFLGKLIIIVTLFLIAYDKFKHSNLFVKDYTHSLSQLQTIASKVGYSLPPVTVPLIQLEKYLYQFIQYSGLFDAFIGVLLLVGDGLGVPILFLRFLVPAIIYYVPWNSRLIQTYSQKISVIRQRFSLEIHQQLLEQQRCCLRQESDDINDSI